MDRAFIRFGHGYDNPTMGDRQPCTAFDGFKVIASPLGEWSEADRESRVWHAPGAQWGVTYASHMLKLAEEDSAHGRGLYILVHHGGGREVLQMATGPDWRAVRDVLLSLDERTLYAMLYSVWQTAKHARSEATSETSGKWAQAFADKRIRQKRATRTRGASVEIVPEWEAALKQQRRAAARQMEA